MTRMLQPSALLFLCYRQCGPPLREPMTSHVCLKVRCYVGDNEERWFMWYSGRSAACLGLDAVTPAAGSIGAPIKHFFSLRPKVLLLLQWISVES